MGANILPRNLDEFPFFIHCFTDCFFAFGVRSRERKAFLAFMKSHVDIPAMQVIKDYIISCSKADGMASVVDKILADWAEQEGKV